MAHAALDAVLFDAAGTLIRPREPIGEVYARAAAAAGVALPAWRIEDAFRRVLRRAPAMAFPGEPPPRVRELERAWWRDRVRETFLAADSGVRFRDFDGLFEDLFRTFAEPARWEAVPGARGALAFARARGLRTGIVSNFDHRLHGILQGLDLTKLVDDVTLPADVGAAKPDRRIFEVALARLGSAPERAVYVGDDADQDVAAARAAGLRAIQVEGPATLAALPERLVPWLEATAT
jgi:putative hydrolase of the HAD superfamily